jgi:arylsulfatase A-like enzyme
VVITSDHGEILYEHEFYFGHDIALYDECTMVPLLLRVPGLQDVRHRVERLVQSIDIMPTVLEALGLGCPDEVEGKSLLPLTRGTAATGATGAATGGEGAFSETFPFPEKCPPRHAVRTETAKLIWREEPSGKITKEYYDLTSDPRETKNLWAAGAGAAGAGPVGGGPAGAGSLPPEASRLDLILSEWLKPAGLRPAPIPSAAESGRLKILKSLGYVD